MSLFFRHNQPVFLKLPFHLNTCMTSLLFTYFSSCSCSFCLARNLLSFLISRIAPQRVTRRQKLNTSLSCMGQPLKDAKVMNENCKILCSARWLCSYVDSAFLLTKFWEKTIKLNECRPMFFSPSYHLLSCHRLQKQCLDKIVGQSEFPTYLLKRGPL